MIPTNYILSEGFKRVVYEAWLSRSDHAIVKVYLVHSVGLDSLIRYDCKCCIAPISMDNKYIPIPRSATTFL